MLPEPVRLAVLKAKDEGNSRPVLKMLWCMALVTDQPFGKVLSAWKRACREIDSVWPKDS